MSPAAYQLKSIQKSYKAGDRFIPVLKDISLTIPAGQFAAIVGPSGSGKSTLMHLLGCLDLPTKGQMSIMGQSVHSLSDDQAAKLRCRHLGFIFQSFHLLPSYDAVSNVALSYVYSGKQGGEQKAKRLLQKLGMGHRLRSRPPTLSGGEKQRVAIARALANNPDILLADEPTGSLDQSNGRMILDLIHQFHKQGKTIILVTHDMAIAAHAERVIEIVDGRIHSDKGR